MELVCGWAKQPIRLSATQRYHPGQLLAKCKRRVGPYWLRVEGCRLVPIPNEACLLFACQVSAAYHDCVAYNAPEDDGFAADMAAREQRIQQELDEEDGHNPEETVDNKA